MPEGVIDYLVTDTGDFQFTTNAAVASVPISQIVTPAILKPALNTDYFFSEGENLKIKSIGFRLPYQFTWANTVMETQLRLRNKAATVTTLLSEIGRDGRIYIPMVNALFDLDIYVPWAANFGAGNGEFEIHVNTITAGNVSMAGMPTLLDATTFDCNMMMVVEHTRDLSA